MDNKIFGQLNKQENNVFSKELEQKVRDFYSAQYKKDIEEGDLDENIIERKTQGEKSFFNKVLEQVEKAQKENIGKHIVSLFDIDETIVNTKIKGNNTYTHTTRPSLVNLLEVIKNNNVSIGFLTSRNLLAEQLDEELESLKPFMDTKYLFSSRDMYIPIEKENEIKEMDEGFLLSKGDIEKTYFLNELIAKDKYKNDIFIPIDDLQYPSLFKYGVALENNEKFFI